MAKTLTVYTKIHRTRQFVLFIRSCVEVDREKKTRERRIDHIIEIMEERGQDPEAVLASLAQAEEGNPYSTKPAWPVEMPAVNPDPVEMYVQERPLEMVGDLGAREMPVPGGDVNGNQKYVLRR